MHDFLTEHYTRVVLTSKGFMGSSQILRLKGCKTYRSGFIRDSGTEYPKFFATEVAPTLHNHPSFLMAP
jgi:hypothetical protein